MSDTTTEQRTSVCPHCQEPVKPKAKRCPHCREKIKRGIGAGGVLGILILFVIIGSMLSSATPTTPPSSNVAPTPEEMREKAQEIATWKTTPAGKLCASHPAWKREDCELLIQKRIWVGMSYDMLVFLYGKPDSINPSNYGQRTQYQYCWNDYRPSCFYDHDDDSIIDAYN